MKRTIRTIAILLAMTLLLLIAPLFFFTYADMTRYYVEYDTCAAELLLLTDYLKENYSDSSVSYLGVDTKNGRLYDPEKGYLDISEALSTAIVKIGRDGFVCKDAVWDVIRFKDGRIQFDIENGAYALIYSLDGKPTYIHKPDEDNRIYVRGIEDRWYHVSKIS